MAWTNAQKYVAEFIGTFGLLAAVTGAALFTNPVYQATYAGSARDVVISLSVGLAVLGMAYALGDISGGHYNPAITIGVWLSGRMPARDVPAYIVAQVLGGILGVATIAGVAYGNSTLWGGSLNLALASQGYAGNGSPYSIAMDSVFLVEVAMTFFLVFVALRVTDGANSAKNLAPVSIALTLVMTNLVAIPIDGASINPARSFAPALLQTIWNGNNWAIQQNWLFWVAPILGGILAAMVVKYLAAPKQS